MQNNKKTGLIERIIWIFAIAFSIMLGVSTLSPYFNPQIFWIPAFFGIAYPYLLIITIILTIIIMFFSLKKSIFPILIIVLSYNNFKNTVNLFASKDKSENQDEIKILSQNIHVFDAYSPNSKITSDSVINVIRLTNPDIACFQEFYENKKIIKKSIADFKKMGNFLYEKKLLYLDSLLDPYLSMITFSKFPIINNGYLKLFHNGFRTNFALWCDIATPNDTIRVYSVHLQSIGFSEQEENLFSNNSNNKSDIENISKSTVRKLKRAFIYRSQEVVELKKSISSSPFPVFIVGDFNDTPVSYTYKQLSFGLKDAFLECGSRGLGCTYNGPFPSFRIDYILFSEDYSASNFRVLKNSFSDHYPITCNFIKNR